MGVSARVATIGLLLLIATPARAYSVLTHEQIVDIAWKDDLEPLLRARFPRATEEELTRAHAYAYGGCVMPDMGYYPFGSHYFSDLVHYVRTGDFVAALVRDSQDLDEYAFALGALAHYTSDNVGHPAINRAVAMSFPKLRARYGETVTYADDTMSHLQTEVGFDMVQVAKNRYTSDAYHSFIGFEISRPVLERAFAATYGLTLGHVVGDVDRCIGSCRRAVSTMIPEMTRIVVRGKKGRRVPEPDTSSTRHFVYVLSRAQYENDWGTAYGRPSFLGRVLAVVLKVVPKVGPLRVLKLEMPSEETEELYIKSVSGTVARYRHLLHEARHGRVALANLNCDTGERGRLGDYERADAVYARLLVDMAQRGSTPPAGLREDARAFFADRDAETPLRKHGKEWRRTLSAVDQVVASN